MALPTQNSPLLSQSILLTDKGEMSISTYAGKLTTKVILECTKKIKAAFPNLPAGFYDILSERIKENKFTDERLIDAVNNVIDNFVYPSPTIANFVGYDKKIRLYSYWEMINMGPEAWELHKPVKFPDQEKLVWVGIGDIQKYKLKIFEK